MEREHILKSKLFDLEEQHRDLQARVNYINKNVNSRSNLVQSGRSVEGSQLRRAQEDYGLELTDQYKYHRASQQMGQHEEIRKRAS